MNFKNFYKVIFSLALFSVGLGNAFAVNFHTYHTSLTRIDCNTKEKSIEISIQLFTHDLVPLLERRAKKSVDLEKTADVDKIIFGYLNENFILKDKTGAARKLIWIGKEVQVDTVYVYVETASDEDLDGFNLQNTLFFESFPEQTNLVIARYNGKKADLLFKAGDKFKKIESAKPPAEN